MTDDGAKTRRYKLPAWAAAFALAFFFGLYLWRAAAARPYRRTDYLFGTLIEITAYGSKARAGVEAAFAAMRAVAQEVDPQRPTSDLARLNRAAGEKPVRVTRETMVLLALAKEWWRRSAGAFDVTVGPLVHAWGFDPGGRPHLPSEEAIAAARRLVGAGDLFLDEAKGTAFLKRPGMAVDLGGMAKGYAVDLAYEALRRAGVRSALINAGGSSIRVLGRPPQGGFWRIGIAHPRKSGEFLAILRLGPGEAMGTSADNQRFFMAGGRRYSHLLDPATGYPAAEAILFSVVAKDAAVADILSTACFVRGPEAGLELARAAGAEAIVYAAGGAVKTTKGLRVADKK